MSAGIRCARRSGASSQGERLGSPARELTPLPMPQGTQKRVISSFHRTAPSATQLAAPISTRRASARVAERALRAVPARWSMLSPASPSASRWASWATVASEHATSYREVSNYGQVGVVVHESGRGLFSVPPGASDLLVVGVDRTRWIGVDYPAHVGLVDAHTERHCGGHYPRRPIEE